MCNEKPVISPIGSIEVFEVTKTEAVPSIADATSHHGHYMPPHVFALLSEYGKK